MQDIVARKKRSEIQYIVFSNVEKYENVQYSVAFFCIFYSIAYWTYNQF